MFVFFAVVIVNVRRADPVFHDLERCCHALANVCVTHIEYEPQVQVRNFDKVTQPFRC